MAVAARGLVRLLVDSLNNLENAFLRNIFRVEPQFAVIVSGQDKPVEAADSNTRLLDDIIGNGILWAVPKSRRTLERRLKRKFGDPYYVSKMLLPKTNIRVCDTCGHHHEERVLCPNCYAKVKKETEAIQAAVQAELGLTPDDKGVIVLYEGEKEEHPAEYWKGKRIIEMKKPRPVWFSQNLLQKSVESSSPKSSEVKSVDLG